MKVVADTSPIHYLILIDQTDLLAGLFGRVFVPPAVEAELRHPSAPAVVRQTIAERPDWLETVLFKVDPVQVPVVGLHAGERDAILLADFIAAELVLLDERKARRAAVERGPQGRRSLWPASPRRPARDDRLRPNGRALDRDQLPPRPEVDPSVPCELALSRLEVPPATTRYLFSVAFGSTSAAVNFFENLVASASGREVRRSYAGRAAAPSEDGGGGW